MGRPDMDYFGFTNKYFACEPIKIFNNGDFENDLYRDFTYIDDIVEGMNDYWVIHLKVLFNIKSLILEQQSREVDGIF